MNRNLELKITEEIDLRNVGYYYKHNFDNLNISLQDLEDAFKDFKSQKNEGKRIVQIGDSDYYLGRHLQYRQYLNGHRYENLVYIKDKEGLACLGYHDDGYGWSLISNFKLKDLNAVKEVLIELFGLRRKI